MKINRIIGEVRNKNILLLQGPMGSYFNSLDKRFTENGSNTYRIGFNAADKFFADYNHFTGYKGKPKNWHKFIKKYYTTHLIDKLFVFGDCRFYQKIAIQIANEMNIEVFVFEEGYIRPNYITLEQYGVNGFSQQPRDRKFYDNFNITEDLLKEIETAVKFKSTYSKLAWEAISYYWIANLFWFRYPYYIHHRNFTLWKEFKVGCINVFRKIKFKFTEKNLNQKFENELHKKYYFVPLQTHGDFQIKTHSDFRNIKEFIEKVMYSFSKNSTPDKYLVFKHHPVDRGRANYLSFINGLADKLNIRNNVIVTWDVHLPTLLKHSIGTVVINSTVGISSLYHNTPTFCLGEAIYDIDGLTSSSSMNIDEFWNNYKEVDSELFKKYRAYLISTTQINSNFYL